MQSMTTDVKIVFLTEAKCEDVEITFEPILKFFKEITILTPSQQEANVNKRCSDRHLVLIDGKDANNLNFAIKIATLSVSVNAIRDSDSKLAL